MDTAVPAITNAVDSVFQQVHSQVPAMFNLTNLQADIAGAKKGVATFAAPAVKKLVNLTGTAQLAADTVGFPLKVRVCVCVRGRRGVLLSCGMRAFAYGVLNFVGGGGWRSVRGHFATPHPSTCVLTPPYN